MSNIQTFDSSFIEILKINPLEKQNYRKIIAHEKIYNLINRDSDWCFCGFSGCFYSWFGEGLVNR